MADPIVVDFEGFANKRPVLAGVLVEGAFKQFAFVDVEPGIASAARASRVECVRFADFCAELMARAQRERRPIAGYSMHERKWIAAGLGGPWPGDVEYVDAKRSAKAWRSRRHPEAAARVHPDRERMRQANEWRGGHGNRLVDFVRLMGSAVPADYGDRGVTGTLRRVLVHASRQGRRGGISRSTRDAWRNLLRHNRFDCRWALMLLRRGGARRRRPGRAAAFGARADPLAQPAFPVPRSS